MQRILTINRRGCGTGVRKHNWELDITQSTTMVMNKLGFNMQLSFLSLLMDGFHLTGSSFTWQKRRGSCLLFLCPSVGVSRLLVHTTQILSVKHAVENWKVKDRLRRYARRRRLENSNTWRSSLTKWTGFRVGKRQRERQTEFVKGQRTVVQCHHMARGANCSAM